MELLPQALMDGILLGGIYITIAIAFSLTYGVMHIIDFAVGEWIMFGAFAGYYLNKWTGIDPFLRDTRKGSTRSNSCCCRWYLSSSP